jgi:hypothetical protein
MKKLKMRHDRKPKPAEDKKAAFGRSFPPFADAENRWLFSENCSNIFL